MIVTSISNNLPLRDDHWDLSLIPLMINTSNSNNLPLRVIIEISLLWSWSLIFEACCLELWVLLCNSFARFFVPSCFVIFDPFFEYRHHVMLWLSDRHAHIFWSWPSCIIVAEASLFVIILSWFSSVMRVRCEHAAMNWYLLICRLIDYQLQPTFVPALNS